MDIKYNNGKIIIELESSEVTFVGVETEPIRVPTENGIVGYVKSNIYDLKLQGNEFDVSLKNVTNEEAIGQIREKIREVHLSQGL